MAYSFNYGGIEFVEKEYTFKYWCRNGVLYDYGTGDICVGNVKLHGKITYKKITYK